LPGCALFGGGSASDAPTKSYDRRDWEEAPTERTEAPIEPPHADEPRPTARLLPAPPAVVSETEPNAKPSVMSIPNLEPVKLNTGTTGMMETLLPVGVKSTAAQGPPPLPPLDKKSELAPLTQAIQLMLDDRHQDAIKVLGAYDPETQEFFLRVLPPLTRFARTPISKLLPEDFATLDIEFRNLREFLRTRCELLVNKMSYCKEIRGFGDCDPLPENHAFLNATKDRPGDQVQMYVELKNFASLKGQDGAYLTKLSCSLQLHDSNNKEVWKRAIDPRQTTYRRSACLNDYHGN
jgi:hypothetical protein